MKEQNQLRSRFISLDNNSAVINAEIYENYGVLLISFILSRIVPQIVEISQSFLRGLAHNMHQCLVRLHSLQLQDFLIVDVATLFRVEGGQDKRWNIYVSVYFALPIFEGLRVPQHEHLRDQFSIAR